jgi:hypothetical protein
MSASTGSCPLTPILRAGRGAGRLGGIVEHDVYVRRRETSDLDIEVEIDQALQLELFAKVGDGMKG